ncbi:unnamed protein product [Phytophthora fragariaefolia]|uniref:Unnamed protein product n=1 Tax=Phytophthora fragariaefolia TaxID=1490495 RepID=A0A9W6X499_9STRA|nr:unnamed protein product [Phytophthora fragariaefolia]
MTELPIQISRLPVQPVTTFKLANPTASSTGGDGFKLSLVTPRRLSLHCCLVFRNFYVAWLRIVQINTDGSSTELASAYPLMQHMHYEDDAQTWKLVRLDQLPVSWNPQMFDSLCVYLSQPSPIWEVWELREIKLYVLPQEQADGGEVLTSTQLGSASPPRLEKKGSLGRSGSVAEGRLTQLLEKRASRTSLGQGGFGSELAANPVEDQATRCLDLMLRLRELLKQ